jgi:hypothetical protein
VSDSSLECGLNALLNRGDALPHFCFALERQNPNLPKAENVERERNGIEGAAWHFHLLSPQELPNRYRITKRN